MALPSRRSARVLAFQILYQRSTLGVFEESEKALFQHGDLKQKHIQFATDLIQVTWDNQAFIDQIISSNLSGWRQGRLSNTLNTIFRFSTCELLMKELDEKIIINEAIEICRYYSDKGATKLCNGVLNSIATSLRNGKIDSEKFTFSSSE